MNDRIPSATNRILAFLGQQIDVAGGRAVVARRLGKKIDWLARRLRGDTGSTFEDLVAISRAAGVTPRTLVLELVQAVGGQGNGVRLGGALILFDDEEETKHGHGN